MAWGRVFGQVTRAGCRVLGVFRAYFKSTDYIFIYLFYLLLYILKHYYKKIESSQSLLVLFCIPSSL